MLSIEHALAMPAEDDGCHGDDADMHAQVMLTHSRVSLGKLCTLTDGLRVGQTLQ